MLQKVSNLTLDSVPCFKANLDGTRISATAMINLQDQYYHYLASSSSAADYSAAEGPQGAW